MGRTVTPPRLLPPTCSPSRTASPNDACPACDLWYCRCFGKSLSELLLEDTAAQAAEDDDVDPPLLIPRCVQVWLDHVVLLSVPTFSQASKLAFLWSCIGVLVGIVAIHSCRDSGVCRCNRCLCSYVWQLCDMVFFQCNMDTPCIFRKAPTLKEKRAICDWVRRAHWMRMCACACVRL
jgi:hypothetical protein